MPSWSDKGDAVNEIPTNEHVAHHEFLRDCIPLLREYLEDRKSHRDRMDKFKASTMGAVATLLVGSLFSFLAWVGHLIIESLKR